MRTHQRDRLIEVWVERVCSPCCGSRVAKKNVTSETGAKLERGEGNGKTSEIVWPGMDPFVLCGGVALVEEAIEAEVMDDDG